MVGNSEEPARVTSILKVSERKVPPLRYNATPMRPVTSSLVIAMGRPEPNQMIGHTNSLQQPHIAILF